mmetsp:Transcript_17626/g.29769  ORF Transcript_17626/g.29769 Transcript_17626/m.29769 type:complete len:125 (+) Transcript_17626:1246-1620(+)
MIQQCRAQGIPVVFSMNRRQLGCLTKFKGSFASVIGIFNYQGAIDEFNNVVSINQQSRDRFYESLKLALEARHSGKEQLDQMTRLLAKENKFLEPSLLQSKAEREAEILGMQRAGCDLDALKSI